MTEGGHLTAAPIVQSLSLTPVGLKEAALDSPSFRATFLHISDQIDALEKWLDSYARSASKLTQEATSIESSVNVFLTNATPSVQLSEAVLDHDYTLLALKRYSAGAREFWNHTTKVLKKLDVQVVDPIRNFLQKDVRLFKEARRVLEQAQRNYESIIFRYMAQAKTKEASSLREDAFQLYEARKLYLKSSLEYCTTSAQLRVSLDKLLIRVFSDQWREMNTLRDDPDSSLSKWSLEMDRIAKWSKEIESGEKVFKRELVLARRQIEEIAEISSRPSRELEAYAQLNPAYIAAQGLTYEDSNNAKPEKQGWLFQRSITGKPSRTVWLRRWFFVNNGVFGCLVQGARSGGVEESEKMSVLLCGIRPATQEERRFCFEVKTKDNAIVLQAETQAELTKWIAAFNFAKRDALEDPASTNWLSETGQSSEIPFSMNAPAPLELSGDNIESQGLSTPDIMGAERSATLPLPDIGNAAYRGSFDLSSKRRLNGPDKDAESGRDHAARIIQKLDLNRKSTAGSQLVGAASPHITAAAFSTLPSASNALLGIQTDLQYALYGDSKTWMSYTTPVGALAPQTLTNPPAPTNLSRMAVIASRERGIRLNQNGKIIPSGLMANLWGSTNWCNVHRLDSLDHKSKAMRVEAIQPESGDVEEKDDEGDESIVPSLDAQRSNFNGADAPDNAMSKKNFGSTEILPSIYPAALNAQDAQFRVLFPAIPTSQHVVLVFRATWNLPGQQEFPGRIYVTLSDMYFYSNHIGLVLMSAVSLAAISDITVSKGHECDHLYLHLITAAQKDVSDVIAIKLYLEPPQLIKKRLTYLIENSQLDTPKKLGAVIKTLMTIKVEDSTATKDTNGSENVAADIHLDGQLNDYKFRTAVRVDGNLFSQPAGDEKRTRKLRLPPQPVIYAPPGMKGLAAEREFSISAKALFHVLFGDKSAVFQTLYCQRGAMYILQSPWYKNSDSHLQRDFEYGRTIHDNSDHLATTSECDHQIVDVLNDHLCYVISYVKYPWHLPKPENYRLRSKIVITHVGKTQCKMAIYIRLDWLGQSNFWKGIVESAALRDMKRIALDIVDVVADQVERLGIGGGTKKAMHIFGHVGQQIQASRLSATDVPPPSKTPRFQVRQKPLYRLLLAAASSSLWDHLVTIMSSLMDILQTFIKVASVHNVLFFSFLISISMNMLGSSAILKDFWTDQRTTNTMRRLGVHADTFLTRSVTLKDISETWDGPDIFHLQEGTKCFKTYSNLAQATDESMPYDFDSSYLHSLSARHTARRLRRNRQNIAAQRHDLLVAMRVVNILEKEILQAEWENWLFDENRRCYDLKILLPERDNDDSNELHNFVEQENNITSQDDLQKLREWSAEYCQSCALEKEKVIKAYQTPGTG